MRLQGKVAIITGGANGLGLAATKRFLEEGAKVIIVDYNEVAGNEAVQTLGENSLFIKTDVTDVIQTQEMAKEVIEKFGKIDILINNAGITKDAMLHKMTEDQFDAVININLKGVFNCTKAVVPYMRENNYGRIINTSSVVGIYGNIGQTNYAATKSAVIGMTKTWSKELGLKQITVNAVAPGFMRTAMVETMPEKVLDKMEQMTALKALGEAEDVANAYLFLASDEAKYITGHTLHVDGGIMM